MMILDIYENDEKNEENLNEEFIIFYLNNLKSIEEIFLSGMNEV
jgi:hypothetical protein